jgi:NADH:ubiquinone oxidoreductase subunit 5 (subunit L)/multisubunit Na+/H+ antiporter MnhA subunit
LTALPLYLVPLVAFLGCLATALVPSRKENRIHQVAAVTSVLFLVLSVAQVGQWVSGVNASLREPIFVWGPYRFEFSLAMDSAGAVFLAMTALLGGLVVRFSQYYMHREAGQKRFFGTLLMFMGGMSVVVLAGDITTLFMGWEFVGIASFLLIGFYRHRELPVRNALKVYSIYRLCDVGLLAAAYVEHHTFGTSNFQEQALVGVGAQAALPIGLLLLLSAAGKSGQFPFSFWVARAMEGPTPSSAIFYGALSIHVGMFLLLRTMPIWFVSDAVRVCIGLTGIVTALVATVVGHVQSNIKGRIGYASVAQVGVMFVELALGLETWVLVHFVGNASLRCYQLLVSPSVVAYVLRLQSSATASSRPGPDRTLESRLAPRWRASLYVWATQEAYMEGLVNRLVFSVPQWLGRHVFAENTTILRVWTRTFALLTSLVLAVSVGVGSVDSSVPFLASIVVSYLLGLAGILLLPAALRGRSLERFGGFASTERWSARLVFLSFLGMSGFPITPAFFGADLLMSECMKVGYPLALFFSGSFLLSGIVLARAFTRLYLGPSANQATVGEALPMDR